VSVSRDQRNRLLEELQKDFPVTSRPFEQIGLRCGLSEDEAVRLTGRMISEDLIREIAALLDGRKLGFKSTLVAVRAPEDRIETIAERINRHPGVSHNYVRDHWLNIWFTLVLPGEIDFDRALSGITDGLDALILPSLRVFKLRVQLPMRRPDGAVRPAPADPTPASSAPVDQAPAAASPAPDPQPGPPQPLTAFERAVLTRIENPLPVEPHPWRRIARDLEVDEERLFTAVRRLKVRGVIRRIAAVLRHRRAGFAANGMAVFRVPESRIEAAGLAAASFPEVSHCYHRRSDPRWPYSLYTMAHAHTREQCDSLVDRISRAIDCSDFQLLYSTRELKKRRTKFFCFSG